MSNVTAQAQAQAQKAAAALRGAKAQVMQKWEDRSRKEMPHVAHLSSRALHDSLFDFIDQLAKSIGAPASEAHAKATSELAEEHGRQRAALPDYSLDRVLYEYQILREVLIEHLTSENVIEAHIAACIHAFVDRGMRKATLQYIEVNAAKERDLRQGLDKVQDELSTERHKLAAVFAEAPALVALFRGPELVFDMVNPSYRQAVGERELLGKSLEDALPELRSQPFIDIMKQVYATGQSFVGHELCARIEGDEPREGFWDVTYVRMSDGSGRPYGVYNHAYDVTERVIARQKLELLKSELEKVVDDLQQEQAVRERYVAALTHDLRTPLTAAKLAAEVIQRQSGQSSKTLSKAEVIIRNMDRADGMIQDLLDASRLKAGGTIPVSIRRCSFDQLVEGAVSQFSAELGGRIKVLSLPGIPVHCDPNAVQRILENLCTNAFKYGAPGGPITINCAVRGSYIEIQVHNDGNPIAPADVASLFEPYKRTAAATSSGQKGWGIGLSVVKGLAEAHGGSVRVESAPSTGTTFEVQLPLEAKTK